MKVGIEPYLGCNLNCPACFFPRGKEAAMPFSKYRSIVDSLRVWKGLDGISLFWRGEPTLNPDLPEFIDYNRSIGVPTQLNTNGCTDNLNDYDYVSSLYENLDRIIISFDGLDQQDAEKYRKGINFSKLIKFLELQKGLKVRKEAILRVCMFRWNEHRESEFVKVAEKYNLDKVYFVAPVILGKMEITSSEARKWMSSVDKYQRYCVSENGNYTISQSPECPMDVHQTLFIDIFGNTHGCCDDRFSESMIFNILEDGIEVREQKMEEVQQKMKSRDFDFCQNACLSAPREPAVREVVEIS